MTELFIPYTQALALKELGFDEPCIMCYYGISRDDKFDGLYLHTGTGKVCNTHLKEEEDGITAPLYQQAFKWFREKHNLNAEIQAPDGSNGKWNPTIHKIKGFGNYYDNDAFETYEEAELACLKKLIEIVEPKSE